LLGITFTGIDIVIGAGTGVYITYKDGKKLIPILSSTVYVI
jgi:hypothetical protein